ncbi:MAG: sodium ion-translocating decarboxylase subunit beta, partial [Clostridia bacterium]|nr:sodium ion-translocating decarboxylase subunit beta [Clostridia bacterium]
MNDILELLQNTGFYKFVTTDGGWKNLIMIAIGFFLLYLAIGRKYEPLLLLPIAFGIILTNLPGAEMFHAA